MGAGAAGRVDPACWRPTPRSRRASVVLQVCVSAVLGILVLVDRPASVTVAAAVFYGGVLTAVAGR